MAAPGVDLSAIDTLINAAIAAQTFPGAAVSVVDATGAVAYARAYGSRVYPGETPPLGGPNLPADTSSTLWDMASLTKIMGGTTAVAVLVQGGHLGLDDLVASPALLGPRYAVRGKGVITLRDCMLHRAGYFPDPVPNFNDPSYGCPSASAANVTLTFSCSATLFTALLEQPLQYAPRSSWLYSDLSFITVAYVVGGVAADAGLVPASALRPDCAAATRATDEGLWRTCAFEAFVRLTLARVGLSPATGFLPPRAAWPDAQPTYADPAWRRRIMQGEVSDANAYALGGVAGHAGVFATLDDATAFLLAWGYTGGGVLEPATRTLFTTPPAPATSPRALGWLTLSPADGYRGCGGEGWSNMSVYHTGYTGTQICWDPTTKLGYVLLTTRVYPDTDGNNAGELAARQGVASAITAAYKRRAGAPA